MSISIRPASVPLAVLDQPTSIAQLWPGIRSNGATGQPFVVAAVSVNEPDATRSTATCNTALPLLCTVNDCAGTLVTSAAALKLNAMGVSVIPGCAADVPLPDSATSAGLVPFDATCSVPARAPTAPGWKASASVQLAPGASATPTAHVPALPSEKSPACAPASVNCCKVTLPGPWLASVSVRVTAAAPTLASLKLRAAADGTHASTGDASTPAPVRPTVCGEPTAFEATLRLPLAAPLALGVKEADKVHDAPAATLAPQLLVTAKGPVAVMPPRLKEPEPVFVSVTVRSADSTPIPWLPKSSEPGARLTAGAGAAAPVPARLSTALPLLAFEAMVKVALRAPTAPGVKVKLRLHVAPAARLAVAVHVPLRVKSAATVPVSVSALNTSAAEPLLTTVTLCAIEVLPTICALKVSALAFRLITACGAVVPVPLRVMLEGEPAALCTMARLALRAPVAVGVNASLITHDAFGATLLPAAHVVPVAV